MVPRIGPGGMNEAREERRLVIWLMDFQRCPEAGLVGKLLEVMRWWRRIRTLSMWFVSLIGGVRTGSVDVGIMM